MHFVGKVQSTTREIQQMRQNDDSKLGDRARVELMHRRGIVFEWSNLNHKWKERMFNINTNNTSWVPMLFIHQIVQQTRACTRIDKQWTEYASTWECLAQSERVQHTENLFFATYFIPYKYIQFLSHSIDLKRVVLIMFLHLGSTLPIANVKLRRENTKKVQPIFESDVWVVLCFQLSKNADICNW